jgi:uracil-DNA glycosylase family 4
VEANWKQEINDKIIVEISRCVACELHKTRTNPVPGEGGLYPKVMLVGEGPGANEDKLGRPFVGDAGKILDKLLGSINLSRTDVFIGNTVKCRPPNNRTPTSNEIETCKPFLISQISLLAPKIVVILGNAALISLLGTGCSISKVRGTVIVKEGIRFFPTFHPAAALYRREVYEIIQADFLKLQDIIKDMVNT